MKKYIYFSLFLFVFIALSCNNPKNTNKETQYKLYLATLFGVDYPISIWVNDKLIYNGKFISDKNSSIRNYMFIDCFTKQNRTSFRVHTAIKDTSFYYKTDTIESLDIWLPYPDFKYFEVKDNNTPMKEGEAGLD